VSWVVLPDDSEKFKTNNIANKIGRMRKRGQERKDKNEEIRIRTKER
jgi:hypothetical protein